MRDGAGGGVRGRVQGDPLPGGRRGVRGHPPAAVHRGQHTAPMLHHSTVMWSTLTISGQVSGNRHCFQLIKPCGIVTLPSLSKYISTYSSL